MAAVDKHKMEIWCGVLGAGSIFPVDIARNATVANLRATIFKQERFEDRFSFPASAIKLFMPEDPQVGDEQLKSASNRSTLLAKGKVPDTGFKEMDPLCGLDDDECFGSSFPTRKRELHVLVKLPDGFLGGGALTMAPTIESGTVAPPPDVWWVGMHGSIPMFQGVNLTDARTLPRTALVNQVIDRLDSTHVLLVKSPPMTGKTSLAALVCRELNARRIQQQQRVLITSCSTLVMKSGENFSEAFHNVCKIKWDEVLALPRQGYTVYVVIDEAQALYGTAGGSPKRKSSEFWRLVKHVVTDTQFDFRVLLLAAYGSDPRYIELSTPVEFSRDLVLDNEQLSFREDEIHEYVTNWFTSVHTLGDVMDQFCALLLALTGGHVGLCVTTIRTLNDVPDMWTRGGDSYPTAQDWIYMLQSGSLTRRVLARRLPDPNPQLFNDLMSIRAVRIFHALQSDQQRCLERLLYGTNTADDEPSLDECVRSGVLVRTENEYQFSSPIMWRYFVKMRVGHIERTADGPRTLEELIQRSLRTLDFNAIRQTLGRSLRTGIPLERAWQMEFYKAVYRCTPHSFVTSADVGALFGSPGFIDFTVHGGDHFWGIELLRDANKLREHVHRFAPGEPYSLLQLSDHCLIDFRQVAAINDTTRERLAPDLNSVEKLYVVCYTRDLSHVMVFHGRNAYLLF